MTYCLCNHPAICHGFTEDEVAGGGKLRGDCSRCACTVFEEDPIYEPVRVASPECGELTGEMLDD